MDEHDVKPYTGETPFLHEAAEHLGVPAGEVGRIQSSKPFRALATQVHNAHIAGCPSHRPAIADEAIRLHRKLAVAELAGRKMIEHLYATMGEACPELCELPVHADRVTEQELRVAELELELAERSASLASANAAHEDQVAALEARIEELEAAIDADPIGEDDTPTLGPKAEAVEDQTPPEAEPEPEPAEGAIPSSDLEGPEPEETPEPEPKPRKRKR